MKIKKYYKHLEDVHEVLQRYNITDENILVAAYLHDSVEDTQMKVSLIEKYFNSEIANIVYCVTNEHGIDEKEKNQKTYTKLAKNQKAIILKLADRIANVENGIENNNKKHYNKYRDSYEIFKYYLYSDSHVLARGLWKHLDSLFDNKKNMLHLQEQS